MTITQDKARKLFERLKHLLKKARETLKPTMVRLPPAIVAKIMAKLHDSQAEMDRLAHQIFDLLKQEPPMSQQPAKPHRHSHSSREKILEPVFKEDIPQNEVGNDNRDRDSSTKIPGHGNTNRRKRIQESKETNAKV